MFFEVEFQFKLTARTVEWADNFTKNANEKRKARDVELDRSLSCAMMLLNITQGNRILTSKGNMQLSAFTTFILLKDLMDSTVLYVIKL